MIRSASTRRPALLALAACLTIAGCAPGYPVAPPTGAARIGTVSDINRRDPATLRDGGDLRLALTEFPPNFNPLHIDGNTVNLNSIVRPTLPRAFVAGADGSLRVDHDYFTSIELTGTSPQVVTYTLNPKAVWSDGTPLTWVDLAAQAHACSGRDKSFAIASKAGYERVKSVTRGVDDRQAVVTFARPYAEWRGLFGGLQPHAMTASPDAFNTAQLDRPGLSAGPFEVSTIDRGAQRIALTRNPRWWGTRPRLDSVMFLVLDPTALIPALQNSAIDAAGLATLDDLVIAERTPGVAIRHAPTLTWSHLTFNGATGSILSDAKLRLAIARGIDRQAIANVAQHGLTDNPTPLNNHVYVAGQVGYQDNSAPADYDPQRAAHDLDELGWRLNGAVREKDGRQLAIRDVFYEAPASRQIALVAQQNLAQIGVKLVLDAKPGNGFFSQYIGVGDFDIAQFGWSGDAFPLSALTQIYASDGDSNFGKIGSPAIDAKIEQTLAELDEDAARVLANQVDNMLWQEGFSLPLFQSPGDVAVRADLANFGAPGLADLDYTAIGFTK